MQFYWQVLKGVRRKTKLSVNFIISKVGICRKTYWMWENGKRIPSEKDIRKLAKAFGVSVTVLSDLGTEAPLSKESPKAAVTESLLDSAQLYGGILESIGKLNSQLRQSQLIVNAFLCSVKAVFYIKDTRLRYVRVNDYFKTIYDLPPEFSCTEKTDMTFFPAAEAEENTEEDSAVLRTGKAIQNREGYIPGTRKKKWGLISKYPMLDSESKISGIVGTIYDITELKNAERSNMQLRNVIDQVKECIWIVLGTKENPKLIYINDTVKEITGYEKKEFFRNPNIYFNLIVPEDKDRYRAFLREAEYPKKIEYSIKRVSDSKELRLRETVYHDGEINFGVVSDVTEERKSHQLSALIKLMLNNLPQSIALVNISANEYLYLNKARETLYERPSEDFYKNSVDFWFKQCVYDEDKPNIAEILKRVKNIPPGGENQEFYEFRIITPSGKIKWISSSTMIKEIEGQIFSFSMDKDISETRK